ncbi:MAG: hypothetical protein NC314_02420 [Roseburia sp.]|nr:hypothetical protein [Roseburia sp.]MCM1241670.1 hypothetical protein [Roseburia sp.]
MNIKRKIKILTGCIVTAGLTIIFIRYSADLLRQPNRDDIYTFFEDQKEDYEVLFFGSSHVKYGISPMELWHDYGIVSYNMGIESQVLPTTYWQMENILEYSTPKLVVIDCYYLSELHKINERAHNSLDIFPLSRTKINAVFDLLKNEETELTHMEFLWDYSFYHNSWNELEMSDFVQNNTSRKGAGYIVEIETGHEMTEIPGESKLEEDMIGVEYLKRMIEDCQNRGIDVLLTYLPFPAGELPQKEANTVYDIAARYGVNYINFLDMDLLNYDTDCSDDNHINLSGCRKVTDYLGKYIMEHYDVADQRGNDAYSIWHADYADYHNKMILEIQRLESLDYRLLYLFDKDFLAFIEIYDPEIWDNDYYVNLFENLGINRENITKDTDFFVIQNAGQQVDCLDSFKDFDKDIISEYGKIQIFSSENGTYGVYLDGNELYVVTPEQDSDTDIRIVIVDKNTKEVIDQSCFSKDNGALRLLYRKN